MISFSLKESDINGLREAIRRNPQLVIDETGKFLRRGIAKYKSTIDRNPWRVSGRGGGAPIDTGELRQSHNPPIYERWEARIEANRTGTAPYAMYVHEGTRRMEARPWLDHAVDRNKGEIDTLQRQLLDTIVTDLAK